MLPSIAPAAGVATATAVKDICQKRTVAEAVGEGLGDAAVAGDIEELPLCTDCAVADGVGIGEVLGGTGAAEDAAELGVGSTVDECFGGCGVDEEIGDADDIAGATEDALLALLLAVESVPKCTASVAAATVKTTTIAIMARHRLREHSP